MSKTYSFSKIKTTEETHVFEGNSTINSCTAEKSSICNKATNDKGIWISTCLDEDKARKKASELGRNVCGTCVSHLYTTYK